MTTISFLALGICGLICLSAASVVAGERASRWSEDRANEWYANRPWLVGCNFVPSTAINQLEMWQAETFDPATIDRELALAKGLGFNSIRVFLHDMLWQQDSAGFLERIEKFLDVAARHDIGVMFVLFDGVWDPQPQLGKQRDPRPRVHNSGWVQSPSRDVLKDPAGHETLSGYVKGVITRFKDDPRVQIWDIYNEPDNTNANHYGQTELPNKPEMALALIEKAFAWAREVNPSQPITSGVWNGDWSSIATMTPMARFCVEHSDVITFHTYTPLDEVQKRVEQLRKFNRPLLCTEYMARPVGSTFESILPYFKAQKIGAYNWGFVDGKSQTIYPWDSWTKRYESEPPRWFHEIFRKDGSAYDPGEIKLIRTLTGRK